MKFFLTSIVALSALTLAAGTAQGGEYGEGFYGSKGNAAPPVNLKIAIGAPKKEGAKIATKKAKPAKKNLVASK